MTRRLILTSFLTSFALCLTTAIPVLAVNPLDVVEAAQTAIEKKYPNPESIARKMALEELEKIARSGKPADQVVKAILEKFPEASVDPSILADQNFNGIPDEWEKKYKIPSGFIAPDTDQDGDGYTLLQEYKADTDPADSLRHPMYITQVCVSGVTRQRFTGLELLTVDRSRSDKKEWEAMFSVVRNNRKRTEYVRIDSATFTNNNVSFSVVDIELDEKTQDPVVYIQRVGKDERIPCRPKEPVYDPQCRVLFLNTLNNKTFTGRVGETFKLGTPKTGEEKYRIVSADPDKKTAVVESLGERIETFALPFSKDFSPDSPKPAAENAADSASR